MSLVEDVLDVLRMVLEYFGVPPDMLVPVWDSQLCGQYRSIVRMIGTNIPLTPAPRVNFQIPMITYRTHGHVDGTEDTPAIPSFADVLWVFEDEGDSFAKTRNHLPPKKTSTVNRDVMRYPGPAPTQTKTGGRSVKQTMNPDALKKISALENELLKLRAQIAMIVIDGPTSGLTHNAPASPLMSPSRLPALTSTPRSAAALPPPPPPPPPPLPPPPPPCPSSSTENSSVLEMIRQRRNNEKQDTGLGKGPENKGMPSMLDVLKDLNQVKLRSVERSPGGTPVMRCSKGGGALLNDPAALLAEALKRKFAHHRHNNSSDKENSLEVSPFGSPEIPMVPHHKRRSKGRRHL